ncbi:MAG: hypothetical protein ACOVOR_04625 [Rhabdochlamydiaceae bacterium]
MRLKFFFVKTALCIFTYSFSPSSLFSSDFTDFIPTSFHFLFPNLKNNTKSDPKKESKDTPSISALPSDHFRENKLKIRKISLEQNVGAHREYTLMRSIVSKDYVPGRLLSIFHSELYNAKSFWGAGLGVMFRHISSDDMIFKMVGSNIFYDFKKVKMGWLHQIGVGAEIMGGSWELSLNAVTGMSNKSTYGSGVCYQYASDYWLNFQEAEGNETRLNAELGYHVLDTEDFSLYTGFSPYYVKRVMEEGALGAFLRIRPQYKDYIAFEVILSHDTNRRFRPSASIQLTLPLYSDRQNKRRYDLLTERRIYQYTKRQDVSDFSRKESWKYNW